ncbi:hypothetical protein ACQI4E_10380 [Streptomyces sp. CA-252508]|uniref:hypothetical protein n=1 Tax=Streptomyces sp. CA-252508 TaxID=3418946 RepID=UPI003D8D3997
MAARNVQNPSDYEKAVDAKLTTIAQLLAASFVAVAGVGTAFGLSQETLLNAVNNDELRYWIVAGLAGLAIALAICSLFPDRDSLGNKYQGALLLTGTVSYVVMLLLTVQGVTNYATEHGSPTLTEVKVEAGATRALSFTAHADFVKKNRDVNVEVRAYDSSGKSVPGPPAYRAVFRPDGLGDAEQKVSVPLPTAGVKHLTISAWPSNEKQCDCKLHQDPVTADCLTIAVPSG